MFKHDKQQVFSLRKYKGYGLASAVIAAFFLSQTVSADVVDNGNGTTTLSNDKASVVVDSSKFKDDNAKTATELFKEGSYEAETVTTGKDSVTVESKTTVKYQTESGEQIDEDVVKTTSETKELDYKVTGKSGKEYTGDDSATTAVNADLEKKDLIENDGKKYEYVRTETTAGAESTLTETNLNDVTTKASVQGMYNEDGSIKYNKIENGSRVWVLEELEDGSYGKYVLIENAQNLNDDQIREAAKTATSKFSKAEVEAKGGFQPTDSVVVYETNTYAARKQTKIQYGKDFYYNQTASSSNFHKEYIDEIFKVGLDGLEKRDEKYYYNGKEVVTIDDFKKNPAPGADGTINGYDADTENKYYFDSLNSYVIPTTYYDVLSDFLIKHPDSPIFANQRNNVFWQPEEGAYFAESFVARLIGTSFNKKYNLTTDTENFSDKPIETKAENSRPTEKKTYSFVKTELNGDEESYHESTHNSADDMWKQEISLSYSTENVEKVRNWIKGYQSLSGYAISDPFNGKDASEVSKEEYTNAVFTKISSLYWTTMKDNFTPEQIRELRSKFGASSFMLVGPSITNDGSSETPSYSLTGVFPTIYRNSLGVVTENTETFTYHDVITPLRAYRLNADENVVRHIYAEVKKGSVVATYSDEEGNKLADDVNVKTDEYAGEDYTTEAKTIRPIYNYETVNGLTKTTTTTYELIKTPENANGKVVAETTIVVPYVYRKVVTVEMKGSVIATYKDEEGNILASEEKVITNQNSGTYYEAAAKTIQPSATSKITENGREVKIVLYELIKTPDNETGEVVGGETLVVPYVYRKVEINRLVPNNPPVVEEETLKVTRFHTDAGEELQSDVAGFENAPSVIGNYQFTGTTELNEAGDVQTHIYTKIVTEIPNEAPSVEVPEAKVTRFHSDNGEELQADVVGFEDAPKIIGDYQFTGTTEMNEGNDVQTHIYTKIVTEVPNEAPTVEVPEGQVTRYMLEDRETEIADWKQGLEEADPIIGNYQFTGTTETNEADDVRTHIYKLIETDKPGDAPIVENPILKVTRFHTDTGEELKADVEGFENADPIIGNYQFTGKTEMNEAGDVQTHIYTKILSEIPNEAPKVELIDAEVTRYMLEDRVTEIADWKPGLHNEEPTIGNYQYTGITENDEDGFVRTHIYKLIETKIPEDAPKLDKEFGYATRYMLEDRVTEIKEAQEGLLEADKTIGKYQFTGATDQTEDGSVITHIYKLIETDVPDDSPKLENPEGKVTKYVDESGKSIASDRTGFHEADKTIGKYQFTGKTITDKDRAVMTHIYKLIEGKVPNDAPSIDKMEYRLTRFVDEEGHELTLFEYGFVKPKDQIDDFKFTGRSDVDGDVLTHVYSKIKVETKVPNDAPVHEKEALKVTRYVDEDGVVIAEESEGFVPAPKNIKKFEFTGKTELSEDGNIQTHIYRKVVETPEVPEVPEKPETPKTPKKPETPKTPEKPETPKAPEVPAKPEVKPESKPVEKFVKDRLPDTGTESSSLAVLGLSSLLGSLAFMKRRKED